MRRMENASATDAVATPRSTERFMEGAWVRSHASGAASSSEESSRPAAGPGPGRHRPGCRLHSPRTPPPPTAPFPATQRLRADRPASVRSGMRAQVLVPALVLFAAGGTLRVAGAPSPFVLPWDDSTPGVTDASHLNRPIDADARVTVDPSGHFRVRGQRVRFLGMNFATDSPFMPTNRADAVAARLARFGVNAVRFHHLDPPWATGGGLLAYTPRSSRDFNPAQLERIHF